MKKILTLAAITLFTMTSCSDDDSIPNENQTDAVLIRKIIETDENGNEVVFDYIYDGNKLLKSQSSNGETVNYTYTQNRITYKHITNPERTQEFFYTYDSQNMLTEIVNVILDENGNSDTVFKYVYEYNSDGTKTEKFYSGNTVDDVQYDYQSIITENGNIVTSYTPEFNTHRTSTYDEKNDPFKNVVDGEKHNILHVLYVFNDSTEWVPFEKTYIYNDDDFPVSAVQKVSDNPNNPPVTKYVQYFY